MGLGKWWLKHGPGSPGSIAKAVARIFSMVQAKRPELSVHDALRETFAACCAATPTSGPVGPQEQDRLFARARGSLLRLTLLEVTRERHKDLLNATPEVYRLAFEAVLEVLKERVPQQIERELREGDIGQFRDFWLELTRGA